MSKTDAACIALFAACVVFQLFVPPSIGLANNGDFAKMIGRFSLGPEDPQMPAEFAYFTPRWVYDRQYQWVSDNRSSELLLIGNAVLIGWLFSTHVFDVRTLGAIHALLWIACFAVFLSVLRPLTGWKRLAVAAAALFVFTDVSYIAYCNSFYTDTAAFLFLAWSVVLWLRLAAAERFSWSLFGLFCAASILCATSKPQNAPLGLFFFVLAVFAGGRRIGALALALSIPASAVASFAFTPPRESQEAAFAAIFSKVLVMSPAPLDDLRELNLGPEYQRYTGELTRAASQSPQEDIDWFNEFGRRASHSRLALFYLRHPWRALSIVYRDLKVWGPERREKSIGNYEGRAGHPPGAKTSSFGWWTALRNGLFRLAPWHIVVWYLAVFAISARLSISHSLARLCVVIILMSLSELAVSSLADAGETDRHLFLFHVLTDFTMLFALAWLLRPRAVPRLR